MPEGHCASCANPDGADQGAYEGADRVRGVKRVAHLEYRPDLRMMGEGVKRHRDKNAVPTPRQFVTHADIGLSIADFAVQHEAGNRWQWHRKNKSNGSATVRTEIGTTERPA